MREKERESGREASRQTDRHAETKNMRGKRKQRDIVRLETKTIACKRDTLQLLTLYWSKIRI